jgi:hypothetical protein
VCLGQGWEKMVGLGLSQAHPGGNEQSMLGGHLGKAQKGQSFLVLSLSVQGCLWHDFSRVTQNDLTTHTLGFMPEHLLSEVARATDGLR